MKCFDIYMADLPMQGEDSHIQQGTRPVIIVSNDAANTYSPVVTVVPLTTKRRKRRLPTHVLIKGYGLKGANLVLAEQVTAIDKGALVRPIGHIDQEKDQQAIQRCLSVQLNMEEIKKGEATKN